MDIKKKTTGIHPEIHIKLSAEAGKAAA